MLSGLWTRFLEWIFVAGLPLVYGYQALCVHPFITTHVADGSGLEYLADQVFTPVHYLLAARTAIPVQFQMDDGTIELQYRFEQRFQYKDSSFWPKTISSLLVFPQSLVMGTMLKTLSYLSPRARAHYRAICSEDTSCHVDPNLEHYKKLGLTIGNFQEAEWITSQGHKRRPGDENYLQADKEALREILSIFEKNQILSWADCGTCFGAYRYGGVIPWDEDVDLAILENDHFNALRALRALDPNKYVVHDWSVRSNPHTYIRVSVKETGAEIDIYHFRIDPEAQTIRGILSAEDNIFMRESWKIRERNLIHPVPYAWIFPLKKANFDGVTVPVPNQIVKYIQSKYGENIDPVKIFNEVTQAWEKDLTHPYWQRPHVH